MEKELPVRKNIRLKGYDYSSPGYYFITIGTKNRVYLFGEIDDGNMLLNEYGNIANAELIKIPSRYDNVRIDNYVIMPNHIHMIVVIEQIKGETERINPFPTADIPNIIGKYKAGVTRTVGNAFMRSDIWQIRFHDYIIRNKNEYDYIYKYINENPDKWEEDKFYK